MYILSGRSRVWIEIPSLDITDQIYATDSLSSTNQAFSEVSADSAAVSDNLGEHVWGITADSTVVTEELVGSISAPLISDTASAADAIDSSDVTAGPITDGITVSDSLLGLIIADAVDDVLVMADVFASAANITLSLSNSIAVSDRIEAGWSAATTDSATVSEVLLTHVVQAEIQDTAATTGSVGGILSASSVVSNSAVVSDLLGYGFTSASTDAATVSDLLAGSAALPVEVLDSSLLGDTLSGTISVYANLTDLVSTETTVGSSLALVGILSDTVIAGDTIRDQAYQVLVVVNAKTGAASTYTVTPTVRGLAEFSGVLYLATESGLYALDADTDYDGGVVWTVKTGFSNMGSDFKKRVRDVNVLGHSAGTIALRTTSIVEGAKVEHDFPLPAGVRTAHRDSVIRVGGGLTSVYWAFEVMGRGRAEIDQLHIAFEQLYRRR